VISPLQIDFPIIIYPGTRHVNFCSKVCIRVIGSFLCSNSNLRETKNTHRALWICNSNVSSPHSPPLSHHSYRAAPSTIFATTVLLCRFVEPPPHIVLAWGFTLQHFALYGQRVLGTSYGARDYHGILNIAASKSWISISYIISAALYKYDKRVVYARTTGIVYYGAVWERTILNPSLKFSEFDHSRSHILQSRNARLAM